MKISILSDRKKLYTLISLVIWIAVWQITAMIVGNSILIAGPFDVIKSLCKLCLEKDFWLSIAASFLRIAAGFILGLTVGVILAVLSYLYKFVEELVSLPMAFIKAAPVAACVVLFLIWWHSDVLAIAVSFCVVMPQIYTGVLQGLANADKKLLEMTEVFKLGRGKVAAYVYIPAIRPFFVGAVKVAAGLAWKSGVAAEVIGTPDFSIGGSLYMSKIYLDTAGVLAWTLVIILLSYLCEKGIVRLAGMNPVARLVGLAVKRTKRPETVAPGPDMVKISNLCMEYDGKRVLDSFSAEYGKSEVHVLNWPSGAGKTTLFRIMAGLTKAVGGEIEPADYSLSYLFQEDRLFEDMTVLENVEVICADRDTARECLLKLLKEDLLDKPVRELSGGQKRRVAIARACSVRADILLLDEPYNGLDEENREKVKKVINEYAADRIVIMASHIET